VTRTYALCEPRRQDYRCVMDDELAPLHPMQVAAYRRMTPEDKLEQALALYWSARRLKAEALRQRHPEWSEAEVEARVREMFLLATS
jgi:hypothetical protein